MGLRRPEGCWCFVSFRVVVARVRYCCAKFGPRDRGTSFCWSVSPSHPFATPSPTGGRLGRRTHCFGYDVPQKMPWSSHAIGDLMHPLTQRCHRPVTLSYDVFIGPQSGQTPCQYALPTRRTLWRRGTRAASFRRDNAIGFLTSGSSQYVALWPRLPHPVAC
jgi:hypothetical protein